MKKLTFLFLLFFLSLYSQKYRYVNAKKGLIVRKYPKKGATRLGKLKDQQKVKLIRKTGIKMTIIDDGYSIPGEWVKIIDLESGLKGYVFNGFLLPNKYTCGISEKFKTKYWKAMSEAKELPEIKLFLKNNTLKELVKYPIHDLESFSDPTLTVMKVFGFKNISHRICVELIEGMCCPSTSEYNYFVDFKGRLIGLPLIVNNNCDCPDPYNSYVFPNEKGGKKDRILLVKNLIGPVNCKKTSREILKEYSWNGKSLNLSKEY